VSLDLFILCNTKEEEVEFDLTLDPVTRQEIQAEQKRLRKQQTKALKSGLFSDGLHALILFSLYFAGIFSGTAFLVAVLLGTVISMVLATGTKKKLAGSDRMALLVIVVCSCLAVGWITVWYFNEPVTGGIIAGLAISSIIITGSLLGRKIMQVLSSLELLEAIDGDHPAHQEMLALCRDYPELEEYRQKARDILRPFLTFGELKAMQKWEKERAG